MLVATYEGSFKGPNNYQGCFKGTRYNNGSRALTVRAPLHLRFFKGSVFGFDPLRVLLGLIRLGFRALGLGFRV